MKSLAVCFLVCAMCVSVLLSCWRLNSVPLRGYAILLLHHVVVDVWVVATARMTYQRMLLSSQLRTAPDHTCDQIQAWPLLASPPPGPPDPCCPHQGSTGLWEAACAHQMPLLRLCACLVYTLPQTFPCSNFYWNVCPHLPCIRKLYLRFFILLYLFRASITTWYYVIISFRYHWRLVLGQVADTEIHKILKSHRWPSKSVDLASADTEGQLYLLKKNLYISDPVQFKAMLFEGQLDI